jgi:hypothetical protein
MDTRSDGCRRDRTRAAVAVRKAALAGKSSILNAGANYTNRSFRFAIRKAKVVIKLV